MTDTTSIADIIRSAFGDRWPIYWDGKPTSDRIEAAAAEIAAIVAGIERERDEAQQRYLNKSHAYDALYKELRDNA